MTEQDEAWTVDRRETLSDVNRRIDHFFDWLLFVSMLPSSSSSYSNGVVVVISHGVWIECLLRRFVGALPEGRRVHNADAFALRLELLDDERPSVVDHDHDHNKHGPPQWVHRVALSHVEQIHDGSGGVVPSGTTAAHPSAPALHRYNNDNSNGKKNGLNDRPPSQDRSSVVRSAGFGQQQQQQRKHIFASHPKPGARRNNKTHNAGKRHGERTYAFDESPRSGGTGNTVVLRMATVGVSPGVMIRHGMCFGRRNKDVRFLDPSAVLLARRRTIQRGQPNSIAATFGVQEPTNGGAEQSWYKCMPLVDVGKRRGRSTLSTTFRE
jgi:hypothetical protein